MQYTNSQNERKLGAFTLDYLKVTIAGTNFLEEKYIFLHTPLEAKKKVPAVVDEYIAKEVRLGRVKGPIKANAVPSAVASRISF